MSNAMKAKIKHGNSVTSYIHTLLSKAEMFCQGNFNDVTYFYRNKPEDYFVEVASKGMIMERILKDKGGDPMSPINGYLKGVFFGVTLRKGRLQMSSPFGDTRIHIPIEALFEESSNLYFTDFYCFTTRIHYVTLVLTKRGTKADDFCRENLPWLNPQSNDFLTRSAERRPRFQTVAQHGLVVEVFYTEDVVIWDLKSRFGPEGVFTTKTKLRGKGHSTAGGIPKHRSCRICNLSENRHQNSNEEDAFEDDSDSDYSEEQHSDDLQSEDENDYGWGGNDYGWG